MTNILVPSEEELSRLIKAFIAIASMQGRMRVLDLAERSARQGAGRRTFTLGSPRIECGIAALGRR